jgi:hypothetical protein
MLAYVDESMEQPSLVVGGGIPPEWCDQPMHVHGMLTKIGPVSWDWDGHAMRVGVSGERCPVRLGPGFPKDARVTVEFSQIASPDSASN